MIDTTTLIIFAIELGFGVFIFYCMLTNPEFDPDEEIP